MLLSGVLLAGGLLAARLPWQAAVVAGLALALSSTAIAVQTMSERNLMGTPVGRGGLGILLFQDIAAIPLIALVPLLGAGSAGRAKRLAAGAAKALRRDRRAWSSSGAS